VFLRRDDHAGEDEKGKRKKSSSAPHGFRSGARPSGIDCASISRLRFGRRVRGSACTIRLPLIPFTQPHTHTRADGTRVQTAQRDGL